MYENKMQWDTTIQEKDIYGLFFHTKVWTLVTKFQGNS